MGEINIYIILLIIFVGLLAGFINTLAGSGSLISLPLLIFLGLPANVANGTNRIAILLQNVVGVGSFYQQKKLDIKKDIWFAVPSVIGSLIGAYFATLITDELIMKRIIGIIMIIMLLVIFINPKKWLKENSSIYFSDKIYLNIIIFFAIGFYGGFIQAGVGIFILMGLVLNAGLDLVRANAVKLLIVLIYTPFALAVFIYNGQINYLYGFILAIGNMIGAFIGTRVAVSYGPKLVRWVLIVIIIVSAAKLLLFS